MAPSSISLRQVWCAPPRKVSGAQPMRTPLALAASISVFASAMVMPSGFSEWTCLPAATACRPTRRAQRDGEVDDDLDRRVGEQVASTVFAGTPNSAPRACARPCSDRRRRESRGSETCDGLQILRADVAAADDANPDGLQSVSPFLPALRLLLFRPVSVRPARCARPGAVPVRSRSMARRRVREASWRRRPAPRCRRPNRGRRFRKRRRGSAACIRAPRREAARAGDRRPERRAGEDHLRRREQRDQVGDGEAERVAGAPPSPRRRSRSIASSGASLVARRQRLEDDRLEPAGMLRSSGRRTRKSPRSGLSPLAPRNNSPSCMMPRPGCGRC